MKTLKITALALLLVGVAGFAVAKNYDQIVMNPPTILMAGGGSIEIFESVHGTDKCYTAVSVQTSVFAISCVKGEVQRVEL